MTAPEPAGFDPQHFARLAEVEDRHFWFASRNRLLTGILRPIGAALPAHARALEIGTGTGNTLRVLKDAWPRATLVGLDLFREGFRVARQRTTAPLVQAAADALPFGSTFDAVAAFDVIEHLADDGAVLAGIRRVLKRRGWLFITVPAFEHLWSRFDEEAHHCRRYERGELRARLIDAGFRVHRLTYVMATLYPVLRTARAIARITAEQAARSSVEANLRIVPVVNTVLKTVLSVEAQLVEAGVSLPFGTSLLAIAQSD